GKTQFLSLAVPVLCQSRMQYGDCLSRVRMFCSLAYQGQVCACSTTIYCICQCSNGSFVLYKGSRQLRTLEQSSGRAEFSISNKGDSGRYSCQCYALSAWREWSAVSNTLDLVVRGETSPQPHPAPLFLPAICHVLGELVKRI
uniref:Uncharacterized protein n=1 Tax=Serinus canaria TaxID=9135 RepID=A0A8C9N8V8_SERCA